MTRDATRRLVRIGRRSISRIGRGLGAGARRSGLLPQRPVVLMYHRIAEEPVDPWGLAVSPAHFDEQLRWLARHRTVVPLAELARQLRAGRVAKGALAITFDDGYACNVTTAAPLLVRHGLPATVFLTTRPISRGAEYWWDDLQRIVFEANGDRLTLDLAADPVGGEVVGGEVVGGEVVGRELVGRDLVAGDVIADGVSAGGVTLSVDLGDPRHAAAPWSSGVDAANPRQEAFMTLWRALRPLDAATQDRAIEELRAQAGTPAAPRPTHRPMTSTEARALTASGLIDIGTHTVTHPVLSEWPEHVQRAEIEQGRAECAAIAGREPTTFAYPYGDYGPRTVELVRAAGFEAACTTVSAAVRQRCDPLELPRLQVGDWAPARLAKVLREL